MLIYNQYYFYLFLNMSIYETFNINYKRTQYVASNNILTYMIITRYESKDRTHHATLLAMAESCGMPSAEMECMLMDDLGMIVTCIFKGQTFLNFLKFFT